MHDSIKLKLTINANGDFTLKLPDTFDYASPTNQERVRELLAWARAVAGVGR